MNREASSVRRWFVPAATIALGSAAIGWIWLAGDATGQERVLGTARVILVVVVLLALWLVLFSGLARRARWLALAGFLIALALVPALFRIRGVTGDLVPILEPRWKSREPALDRFTAAAPAATQPAAGGALDSPSHGSDTRPSAAPGSPAEPALAPAAATPAPVPIPGTAPAGLSLDVSYPQFLGPERNGTVPGIRLFKDWRSRPPRLLWQRQIGAGWSGFAVAHGLAITQEQRGDRELVIAYDLVSGAVKWAHGDARRFESTIAGDGPRATPTVFDGRVYTLGSTGLLNCLELSTGRRIWHRDIAEGSSAQPDWGRSCSPLVVDDLVVVSAGAGAGRSLAAYRRTTGEPVWQAGNDRVGYSSPMVARLAGIRQILIFNQASVAAHDPETGRLLWEHRWPAEQPNVAQPVLLPGDRVLVSSGYGVGSKLLQVRDNGTAGLRAELAWESTRLKAKFTNLVVRDGFVYGLDDGVLVCLDPSDGERRWKSGRYGHGQVLLAGDLLLVQAEDGEVALVEARPDAHRELTRFTALKEKTWNSPALAGRILLVRNDQNAACYELPLEE
jgi:outer membrane protein assembly factor BamB